MNSIRRTDIDTLRAVSVISVIIYHINNTIFPNGYLGVDYKRLVPLLIESIKELKEEVEELKKKVN